MKETAPPDLSITSAHIAVAEIRMAIIAIIATRIIESAV